MASTYTGNNAIEKIGSGEQAGTWGNTTNLNLDIIDRDEVDWTVPISLGDSHKDLE